MATRVVKSIKSAINELSVSFRSLRWRLTLSYSVVTIAALLVVEIIVVTFLLTYFVNNIDLSPENLISNFRAEWTPMVEQFFSEEPPNIEGLREYLDTVQGSEIGTKPLLIFGNIELQLKASDFLSFYYLLEDRTLVDAIPRDLVSEEELGQKMPYDYLPGLENPLQAAMDGVEDENLLYENVEPGNRVTGAIPVFRFEPIQIDELDQGEPETIMDVERNLVGIIVFTTKRFPWEFLPMSEVIAYMGRSLLIFTLFAGILGSVFGLITASGLTRRLSYVSQAAHDWSSGDFSVFVRDKSNDELGQLTHDLNRMAEQLENLLDRRQELSVLEERNRLARDLHDSVKQQAFAASAQLGAAKLYIESQPEKSYAHLIEAECLIGKVRQELTDLIQELRPVEMKGKGLIRALREYSDEWRRRNEIDLNLHVQRERSLPLEVEKSLFRIIQEALSNVAWHSQARKVDLIIRFMPDNLWVTIQDDGKGFNSELIQSDGFGLKSMKERAELIGGELVIESKSGRGTKIIVKYPYQLDGEVL